MVLSPLSRSPLLLLLSLFVALTCLSLLPSAAGHAYGAYSCEYPDSSGMSVGLSSHGGFSILVAPTDYATVPTTSLTSYVPGQQYTIVIRNSLKGYRGFLVQAVKGVPGKPNTGRKKTSRKRATKPHSRIVLMSTN